MLSILAICAALFMALSWFQLWQTAIKQARTDPSVKSFTTLLIGIATQIGLIVLVQQHHAPLVFDLKSAALTIGLTMVCSIMLLSIFPRFNALQLLVIPVNIAALIFAAIAYGIPTEADNMGIQATDEIAQYGVGMRLHIILSVLAYSFASLAFLQSCLLLYQDQRVKRHQLDGSLRFIPPIQTIEQMLFDLILVSLLLLGGAILTGVIFIDDIMAQHLAHKTVFSVLSFLIFFALFLGRQIWGWRGTKAVILCSSGFFMLMLAYFGTKFVLDVLLA